VVEDEIVVEAAAIVCRVQSLPVKAPFLVSPIVASMYVDGAMMEVVIQTSPNAQLWLNGCAIHTPMLLGDVLARLHAQGVATLSG